MQQRWAVSLAECGEPWQQMRADEAVAVREHRHIVVHGAATADNGQTDEGGSDECSARVGRDWQHAGTAGGVKQTTEPELLGVKKMRYLRFMPSPAQHRAARAARTLARAARTPKCLPWSRTRRSGRLRRPATARRSTWRSSTRRRSCCGRRARRAWCIRTCCRLPSRTRRFAPTSRCRWWRSFRTRSA